MLFTHDSYLFFNAYFQYHTQCRKIGYIKHVCKISSEGACLAKNPEITRSLAYQRKGI